MKPIKMKTNDQKKSPAMMSWVNTAILFLTIYTLCYRKEHHTMKSIIINVPCGCFYKRIQHGTCVNPKSHKGET